MGRRGEWQARRGPSEVYRGGAASLPTAQYHTVYSACSRRQRTKETNNGHNWTGGGEERQAGSGWLSVCLPACLYVGMLYVV